MQKVTLGGLSIQSNFIASANTALEDFRQLLETRSCPDQYVGPLAEIGHGRPFPTRQPVADRPRDQPCVIMVLESPHIDEYKERLGGPSVPCPANGSTGRNIASLIRDIPDLDSRTHFGLILMNAVPYQCSLGVDPRIFRDQVFINAWSNGGQTFFDERLLEAYVPGDVLLNCCTKGEVLTDGLFLRDLVLKAMKAVVPNATILCRTHPSHWRGKLGEDWTQLKKRTRKRR